MRKVIGAERKQLIYQFLGETLFLSSFQPAVVFRGALKAGKANIRLRKFLVVVLPMGDPLASQIYPRDPFVYSFLDDDFDSLYRQEKQRGKVFLVFSVLAIFIACLGLFGLASFTAEQRTKEIGIRKVLGASVESIVRLLSKDFLKLVLLGNLLAWPMAYFMMQKWLGNFAYRVPINLDIFFIAGILALFIALATVSFQAVKAALANPADSIRTE